MAKKSDKSAGVKADKTDDIIEAEIVEDKTLDAVAAEEETSQEPMAISEPGETEQVEEDPAEDTGSGEDAGETTETDETPAETEDVVAETEEAPEPAASATSEPAPVVVKRTGFVPMFLGGVAAAVIGFGAAINIFPDGLNLSGDPSPFERETSARLETQAADIAGLRAALGDSLKQQDLARALEGITAQLDDVKTTIARLDATVGGFDARITDLEKRPLTEAISPAAIQAYEREMEALKAEIATQRAEAAEMENNARESARVALGRSAMTRIVSALDSGAPYRGALVDLTSATGASIPAALEHFADDGAPTRASLEEGFPVAARAALGAARKADSAADGGSRLGTFLKNQLGARSVEPREGTDPDAVLSRAEAALRDGRLTDALAELDALPEVAAAEMADWANVAKSRADALQAVATLNQSLNSN